MEIESKLVRFMGAQVWPDGPVAGTFTSGGTEANHTAVIAALLRKYPEWSRDGLAGLRKRPAIYVSSEAPLAGHTP